MRTATRQTKRKRNCATKTARNCKCFNGKRIEICGGNICARSWILIEPSAFKRVSCQFDCVRMRQMCRFASVLNRLSKSKTDRTPIRKISPARTVCEWKRGAKKKRIREDIKWYTPHVWYGIDGTSQGNSYKSSNFSNLFAIINVFDKICRTKIKFQQKKNYQIVKKCRSLASLSTNHNDISGCGLHVLFHIIHKSAACTWENELENRKGVRVSTN